MRVLVVDDYRPWHDFVASVFCEEQNFLLMGYVTDGIEAALQQAKAAATDKPVLIAGGANTVNQYLAAGLIDELWLHIAPVTISEGPKLFKNVPDLKMEPIECRTTKLVTHIKYKILSH